MSKGIKVVIGIIVFIALLGGGIYFYTSYRTKQQFEQLNAYLKSIFPECSLGYAKATPDVLKSAFVLEDISLRCLDQEMILVELAHFQEISGNQGDGFNYTFTLDQVHLRSKGFAVYVKNHIEQHPGIKESLENTPFMMSLNEAIASESPEDINLTRFSGRIEHNVSENTRSFMNFSVVDQHQQGFKFDRLVHKHTPGVAVAENVENAGEVRLENFEILKSPVSATPLPPQGDSEDPQTATPDEEVPAVDAHAGFFDITFTYGADNRGHKVFIENFRLSRKEDATALPQQLAAFKTLKTQTDHTILDVILDESPEVSEKPVYPKPSFVTFEMLGYEFVGMDEDTTKILAEAGYTPLLINIKSDAKYDHDQNTAEMKFNLEAERFGFISLMTHLLDVNQVTGEDQSTESQMNPEALEELPQLKSAEIIIQDQPGRSQIFKAVQKVTGQDPSAMLPFAVMGLSAMVEEEPENIKMLAEKVSQFVLSGGEIKIVISPEVPLDFAVLSENMPEGIKGWVDRLNPEITYTTFEGDSESVSPEVTEVPTSQTQTDPAPVQ